MRTTRREPMTTITRTMRWLTTLALLCLSGCGGEAALGEACDEEGVDGECEGGAVCAKPGDSGELECLPTCAEQSDCPAEQECNGVSNSGLKACRPKKDG
jgi:hypothetical protein